MTAHRHVIRDAATADGARVIDTLSRALASSEMARWLLPNANIRGRLIRDRVCASLSDPATPVNVRIVAVDRQIRGVAVWKACAADEPTRRPPTAAAHTDPDSHRVRQLETRLALRHPHTLHDHLLFLGVSPDHQRHGIGTALLADWHSRLGRAAPCYLVAPETLRPLARRLGYRTVGQRVMPALSAPNLWAMWRPGSEAVEEPVAWPVNAIRSA